MPLDGFHIFWRQMTLAYCATNSIFNQCFSHVYWACPVRSFVGQYGKKGMCLERRNGLDSLCFSLGFCHFLLLKNELKATHF